MEWFIFALGSAILASISAVVEKKTLRTQHALSFSATLAIINALIMIPFVSNVNFSFDAVTYLQIFVVSILATAAFLMVAKSLRHMDVSLVSPLMAFGPAVVVLPAFFILGERITLTQLTGIFILMVGSYVLTMQRHKSFADPFTRMLKSEFVHYLFFALFLYGITSIFDKIILTKIDPVSYLFIVQAFIAINFVFLISYLFNVTEIFESVKTAGKWIFIISLFTVGYRYFQSVAVTMADVSLVNPIKKSSALFSTVIGGELFHEQNILQKSIACSIMLVGVVLIIL